MALCVVVERLEGKQQCSRAPVGEHAEVQAQDAECGCHEQQEVNPKQPKPRNNPSHNHDSTAPRQHPLIYTGAGPIHLVHGWLQSPTTKTITLKGFTFSPFWRALDRRKDTGVVCVFSIFNTGGSACGCMCVYTHTQTHTTQMGYSNVSPGVGMRHLEGPKNQDGLNLRIYIFVYVYKVHMWMYMLGGGMDLELTAFFFNTLFFPKKLSKRYCKPLIISNLK